jgi:hypothetical protein
MPKWYVSMARDGLALATIRATNESDADALALRRLPGHYSIVEVRSLNKEDFEKSMYEAFREMGYSDSAAKVAATERHPSNLHSYETSCTFTESSTDVGEGNGGGDAQRFIERYANPEKKLEEVFRDMGLSDQAARIAAEGR